ncbi:MAG: hypothetical protein Q4D54_07975 [Eubacteriales bacterium]|nr:hypothetical protein [Lachnospiraceae bacterium]MDO5127671.1 hypothetical protein [Eubacteriales bacterium]
MKIRLSVQNSDPTNWIYRIIEKYHFESTDYGLLGKIYEQVQAVLEPSATYRLNHRMTGLAMIDNAQVAIVAMTLGSGIDGLKERYLSKEQLTEAYMVDCLANEILLDLYQEFNQSYAKFHRRYVKRYVFVGDEISPTEIPIILNDIRGNKDTEEICSNEYGVLTPSKSVVFYAILTENPNQVCEGICVNCSNTSCDNYRISDKDEKSLSTEQPVNYGYMRIFGQS